MIYNMTFYLGGLIGYASCIYCYNSIEKIKLNLIDFKTVTFVLLFSFLGLINNIYNYDLARGGVHFILLFLLFVSVFNENFKKTFLKTIFIYFSICFFEICLSFLIIIIGFYSLSEINQNVFVKFLFSNLVYAIVLLQFTDEKIIILINKIIKYIFQKNTRILMIMFYAALSGILMLGFKAAEKLSLNIYISNILILAVIFTLLIFFIIQYIKTKKAEAKEEILLDFMSKYEKMLDNDRINKHEILNNLLILKSFKNKNSKKYEEIINTIINEYENKDKDLFVNLYNLPSGLKGLLYYKVYEMKSSDINVVLNISNKVLPKLEKIDPKAFMKLCGILGIFLDNAKEACELSKDKNIIIDIYEERKKTIIYIENTTKSKVEINKIYEKNYSTKGKNRGLGLYIAKETVRNSTIFELEQFINKSGNFVSILTVI